MRTNSLDKLQIIFSEIGGQFIAVDSAENSPPTLANILKRLNKYRVYGGKIRLDIIQSENK